MDMLYSELQWLPRPSADFTQRLKCVDQCQEACGSEFYKLAGSALEVNQLTALAKAIERARLRGVSLHPLTPFRLGILSNGTVDLMVPALIASAARHGIALEIVRTPFDQVVQEASRPDSHLHLSKPDAVLIAIDYRTLPLQATPDDMKAAGAQLDSATAYVRNICEAIRSHSGAACILQTFAPPVERVFGNLERAIPGTVSWLIDSLNRELTAYVVSSGNLLLDADSLAETVGLAEWQDHRLWNLARIPFGEQFVPLYADHVARIVAACRGRSRKVLILDLDNTLWGGVVGDDGPAGINLAQGDARGEAFRSVQRMALELRQRGILLAVCSKNSDALARAAFDHPEMLLRIGDFAAFQANWEDKATNIKKIAEQLSLGLDSMVFLDDNPAERDLVRQLLPEVAVPELPEDPALYVRTLAAAGYFETATFSAEDLRRADFYEDNAKRSTLQAESSDLDAYLNSLEMTMTCEPFTAAGRARIVQLINKTNQFNLTTRRYTLPEIMDVENDPAAFTMQVRLADRFGDNGMISVIICRCEQPGAWDIDTWLMSCRVLGRRVEFEALRCLLEQAHCEGVHTVRGSYKPTDRNHLVSDHYAKLGFTKVAEEPSGLTRWELVVDNAHVEGTTIRVDTSGFAASHRQELRSAEAHSMTGPSM